MIHLTYIPNVLFPKDREDIKLKYVPGKKLDYYIKEAGYDTQDYTPSINGGIVNQDFDKTEIVVGDHIVLHNKIEGGAAFAAVVTFISWVVKAVAVASAIYSVYKALTYKPSTPSFGSSGDGIDSGSQTYNWDGIKTISRVGGPIPVIYGENKVGGNVINQYVWSDGDKNFLNALLALGQGEIESITDVKFNDNPERNFQSLLGNKWSLEFPGGNQSLEVPTVNISTSNWTYECWAKFDDFNQYSHLFTATDQRDFALKVDKAGRPYFYTSAKGHQKTDTRLSTNRWYHIAWVYDGSNLKLYINKSLDKTFTLSGLDIPSSEYNIGTWKSESMDGKIGDIRLWLTDRSADEISANADSLLDGDETDLELYYSMETHSGTTVVDAASSYDGTLTADNDEYSHWVAPQVHVNKRYGTNDQSVIPHFEDLHQSYTIDSLLEQNSPYTYTTSASNVEAFEVHLRCPYGLYTQNNKGHIRTESVTYRIEYKKASDASYTDLGETTLKAKSRTSVKRIFRKDELDADQYDIRVTRTSDDSTLRSVRDLKISRIDEITTDDLQYPNTALLGIRLLATNQLSGTRPNITSVVKGLKVRQPEIKNGAETVAWEDYYWDSDTSEWKLLSDDTVLSWDGTTYITAYSANPIWCLRDFLTNDRYGLGQYVTTDKIDDTLLLEQAKECEKKVDVTESDGSTRSEKKHRLDVVLDSRTKALDLVEELMSSFSGMSWFSEGLVKIRLDKTETASQIFGMGNVISFEQGWNSKRQMPNIIEVVYNDKNKDYEQEVLEVRNETALETNGEGRNPMRIRSYTNRASYAQRLGRWLINVAANVDKSINIKCGIDAVALEAGDVFEFSHDVPQWGFSGRVQSGSTTTKVKLDRSVTIEAGTTYKIKVRFNDDDTIEERTVSDGAGTYTELNVTSAFSQAPSAYDVYAFGENNKVSKPFRAIGLRRMGNGEVEIEGLEYDENVYDDTSVTEPETNYSSLSREIPDVSELNLDEGIAKNEDGTIENIIDVFWNNPDSQGYFTKQFDHARIYLSDDSGASWEPRGEARSSRFRIAGGLASETEYRVAVVSVAPNSRENNIEDSPQATVEVIGKTAPPSNVSKFNIEQDESSLIMQWTPVQDVDLAGYEIRTGTTWKTATPVDTGIKGSAYELAYFGLGVLTYWIKAIDTSGNYSEEATSASVVVTRRPTKNIVYANYEWGKIGTPDEMWLSEGITKTWGTQLDDGYYTPVLTPKTAVKMDTKDTVFDQKGQGFNFPKEAGTHEIEVKPIDFGAVYDLSHLVSVSHSKDDGLIFWLEDKTSEDNVTWSDYHLYTPGFITAKYWQLRAFVQIEEYTESAFFFALSLFDVPDIKYTMKDIQIEAAGTNITFDREFVTVPTVVATAMNDSGDSLMPIIDKSNISNTGIAGVKVKDIDSGSFVSGYVNLYLEGY